MSLHRPLSLATAPLLRTTAIIGLLTPLYLAFVHYISLYLHITAYLDIHRQWTILLKKSPASYTSYARAHLLNRYVINDHDGIFYRLTPFSAQTEAINAYFTPNASFTHPFCRTGSFEGSRNLIHAIYKWYKLLSPNIELKVNSVGMYMPQYPEAHNIYLQSCLQQPTTLPI